MQLFGVIGYQCDNCGATHMCDSECDKSALPDGWTHHVRYGIFTCEDCDLKDAIKKEIFG